MTTPLNVAEIFAHDRNFHTIMTNMLQTAFEISFDGVMITEAGPGYPIVFVNRALCEMTGYSVEEFIGESPAILQGEKSNQQLLTVLKEKITTGEPFHGKTVNYKKNGVEFIMEWKIVPIRNEHKEISHYLAIQREIIDSELVHSSLDSRLPFGQD